VAVFAANVSRITVSASMIMKRFLAEGKVGCHKGAVDCSSPPGPPSRDLDFAKNRKKHQGFPIRDVGLFHLGEVKLTGLSREMQTSVNFGRDKLLMFPIPSRVSWCFLLPDLIDRRVLLMGSLVVRSASAMVSNSRRKLGGYLESFGRLCPAGEASWRFPSISPRNDGSRINAETFVVEYDLAETSAGMNPQISVPASRLKEKPIFTLEALTGAGFPSNVAVSPAGRAGELLLDDASARACAGFRCAVPPSVSAWGLVSASCNFLTSSWAACSCDL